MLLNAPFVLCDQKTPSFLLYKRKLARRSNKRHTHRKKRKEKKTLQENLITNKNLPLHSSLATEKPRKTRSMSSGEFGSNESGWTKYLGSPSQEEGNHSSGVYDDECNYYYHHHNRYDFTSHRGKHNKDSDDNDSVASDASSGPSHHEAFVARSMNRGGCSKEEQESYYVGTKGSMAEEKVLKGKAAKEPVILDHKGKKGISSLKQKVQKRGKKTN